MPKIKFSDRAIQNLKSTDKPTEYFDATRESGKGSLGVRVSVRGKKTWFIMYVGDNGKLKRFTLGTYPDMSLSKAREDAADVITDTSKGNDPHTEKQRHKDAPTMTDLWTLFQEKNDARQKPKSAATIRQENGYWRNVIEPTIGSMKVEDVTPRYLAEMSKKLAKTSPTSANRLHALLSSLFKPALEHGWITVHLQSEAGLSDDEIRQLWPALDNLRRNPRDQLKIGLLTAQRPGEIATMRWADIDLDNATWTQETTKTGNTFICPLSPAVIAILQHRKDNPGRRYRDNPSAYVFPSAYNVHKGAAGTCAGIPIKQARQVCNNLKMEEWTPHDLRRTARTIMSRLQIKPHIRERCLNHSQGKIEKVYDQFDYLPEKRAAMNKLADEIDRIIGVEHTAKIIPMRAAR